jgi:hypothetical protein
MRESVVRQTMNTSCYFAATATAVVVVVDDE